MGWGQFKIILLLMHQDGLKQDEISSKLEIDKTTVARTLKKLETSGFVSRKKDAKDKRVQHVFLTGKSLEQKEFMTQLKHEVDTRLLENFTEQEKNTLFNLLEKLSYNSQNILSKEKTHE